MLATDELAGSNAAYRGRCCLISECGDTKRQIAYFGDTMNVAGRLCDHCKTAEEGLLVSADLLRDAAVPAWLWVEAPENIALRGRQASVETTSCVAMPAPTGANRGAGETIFS